jgi:microcystin-dependent protein
MDPYLGEIRMFAGTFAPVGWALCDGALVSIAENEALFTLLGTTYGGDGSTTFGLPDLRGRAALHVGHNPTGSSYTLGQKGGTEQVTLTVEQIPAHTHPVLASSAAGTGDSPAASYFAATASADQSVYSDQAPTGTLAPEAMTPSGGSLPHANMMPFVTITYIIATQGIYPSPS